MTYGNNGSANLEISMIIDSIFQLDKSEKGESTIVYRPSFRKITESVNGAILLQQIWFRFKNNKFRPFYKFIAPCLHDLYKDGDSWTEELSFSDDEFRGALTRFATKITAGVSKSKVYSENIVVYWTDSNRITWFDMNLVNFAEAISNCYVNEEKATSTLSVYLERLKSLLSQVNLESGDSFSSENTQENTSENNTNKKIQSSIVVEGSNDPQQFQSGILESDIILNGNQVSQVVLKEALNNMGSESQEASGSAVDYKDQLPPPAPASPVNEPKKRGRKAKVRTPEDEIVPAVKEKKKAGAKPKVLHPELFDSYRENIMTAFGWTSKMMTKTNYAVVGVVAHELADMEDAIDPMMIFDLKKEVDERKWQNYSPRALLKVLPDIIMRKETMKGNKFPVNEYGYQFWYYDHENGIREWYDDKMNLWRDYTTPSGSKAKMMQDLELDENSESEVENRIHQQLKRIKNRSA